MQRKIFYAIIITLLVFSSCSKQGSQEQQSNEQKPQQTQQPQKQLQQHVPETKGQEQGSIYFPKGSNGSQWVYGIRYSAPEGVMVGGMVIQIGGEEVIAGKTYYKQITTISEGIPGAGKHVSYNRRVKEGIYKIDEKTNQENLTTPFPVTLGSVWTTKTSDGHTQFKADKIETVELNDRKYKDCLKVTFKRDSGTQHVEGISYFAPGIGEVYSLMNMGNVKIDYALIRYKLE